MNIILTLLLVIVYLCRVKAFTNAISNNQLSSSSIVLATLVTQRQEILPARVMFQSAFENGQLESNIQFLLVIPAHLVSSLPPLPSFIHIYQLQQSESSLPLLTLFQLPVFKILYISPHHLVVSSLAPLVNCPEFCAHFLTQCSFSASFFVLTPTSIHRNNLNHLVNIFNTNPKSHCHHPPDWLSPSACLLNQLFPNLINASLFLPDSQPKNLSFTPYRLPYGTTPAHFHYYPRMRWELPKQVCSSLITIDFSTPKFLHPSYWWASLFLELSQQWNQIRIQIDPFFRIHTFSTIIWYIFPAIILLIFLYIMPIQQRSFHTRHLSLHPHQVGKRALLTVLFSTVLSWIIAITITPNQIHVASAILIVCVWRFVILLFVWRVLGALWIAPGATGKTIVKKGSLCCAVEVMSVVVSIRMVQLVQVQTVFDKVIWLVVAIVTYLITAMVGGGCMMSVVVRSRS